MIMKTKLITSTFLLLFFMTSCLSSKTAPETINAVTHKVESKDFTVVVNYANPQRMRPVFLTSDYHLRIKNDSAFAFLPYFGVAHIAPLDPSEGGIKFAAPMDNYTITPHKKSSGWDVRFKVRSKESVYEIFMNIYNNGSSTFSISSYERDMISYNGNIVLP